MQYDHESSGLPYRKWVCGNKTQTCLACTDFLSLHLYCFFEGYENIGNYNQAFLNTISDVDRLKKLS